MVTCVFIRLTLRVSGGGRATDAWLTKIALKARSPSAARAG
jgi:hypothetical protein